MFLWSSKTKFCFQSPPPNRAQERRRKPNEHGMSIGWSTVSVAMFHSIGRGCRSQIQGDSRLSSFSNDFRPEVSSVEFSMKIFMNFRRPNYFGHRLLKVCQKIDPISPPAPWLPTNLKVSVFHRWKRCWSCFCRVCPILSDFVVY